MVSVLDLHSLTEAAKPVSRTGAIENLVTVGSAELEQVWAQKVEGKLGHALKLIEHGQLLKLGNEKHVNIIKDCIALHWARGYAITVILRGLMPQAVDSIVNGVLEQYTPTEAVHALNGLYVVGFGAKDVFQKLIYDKLDEEMKQNFLREQFTYHFREAQKRMQNLSLEICSAQDSEFILSDCPVVTWDKDRDVAGVLFGAAWNDADVIFMCVSPKHTVAISKKGRIRELSEPEVVQINKLQIRAAYKEIYYRIGSDLGEKISSALKKTDINNKH